MSDLLARLVASGTPADLIGEVAMLIARAEVDREAIETRRRADRERQSARRHVTSRDITGDNVMSQDVTDTPPALDKEIPPRPPKEINPTPRARAASARGLRLPDGWRPAKLDRSTNSGRIIEGRGQQWAKNTLESFENHWRAKTGKDATKADWQATWANWVIEQDRRDGRNGQRRNGTDNDNGIGRTERAALSFAGLAEHEAGGPEPAPLRRVGPSGGGTGLVASNPH